MSYLEPALPLFLLVATAGLAALWRRVGRSFWLVLAAFGVAGIFLLSSPWFAVMVAAPLESRYATENAIPVAEADAIVVLSGAVDPPWPDRPYPVAGQDTYRRIRYAVWLYRNWRPLPILVCGGSVGGNLNPLASEMRRILESEGIPANMILVESRSASTHENALFGSEVLRNNNLMRVVLVVEANSMLRASLSFEKEGISVVPGPVAFTTLMYSWRDMVPSWHAIARNGETLHEVAGLLWYWSRGWI